MNKGRLPSLILSSILLIASGCNPETGGQKRNGGVVDCPGDPINLTINGVKEGESVGLGGETIQLTPRGLGFTTTANGLSNVLASSTEVSFRTTGPVYTADYTVTLVDDRDDITKTAGLLLRGTCGKSGR